ncbi:hypothetical protein [Mucilaginibacter mallensis]|nr:hypothetical protein [Mucilaginibacter mallensis]
MIPELSFSLYWRKCLVSHVVSLITAKAYFFCLDTKETKTDRRKLMNAY